MHSASVDLAVPRLRVALDRRFLFTYHHSDDMPRGYLIVSDLINLMSSYPLCKVHREWIVKDSGLSVKVVPVHRFGALGRARDAASYPMIPLVYISVQVRVSGRAIKVP